MYSQEARLIYGQVAVIYEVITEKDKPDKIDMKMYENLMKKYTAELYEAVFEVDPLEDDMDIDEVYSRVFYDDWESNSEHLDLNNEIIDAQIEILEKLIDVKRRKWFTDDELAVELGKLSEVEDNRF